MSYFEKDFLPSRNKVIQLLFEKHEWLHRLKNLVFSENIVFRVVIVSTESKTTSYMVKENRNGIIQITDNDSSNKFSVLKIPYKLKIKTNENFLKSWVNDEEKLIKKPLFYFTGYLFRILPKIRWD